MAKRKKVFTVGEVAEICEVSHKTVQKWFDSGLLDGFRLPSSGDRRIFQTEVERFIRENNMPVDLLMGLENKK